MYYIIYIFTDVRLKLTLFFNHIFDKIIYYNHIFSFFFKQTFVFIYLFLKPKKYLIKTSVCIWGLRLNKLILF